MQNPGPEKFQEGSKRDTGTKTRRFSNFVRLRTSSSKTLRFDPISIVIFEKRAYIPAYTRSPSSWNGLLAYSQGIFLTAKVFFLQSRYFSYSQGIFLTAKAYFLKPRYFYYIQGIFPSIARSRLSVALSGSPPRGPAGRTVLARRAGRPYRTAVTGTCPRHYR